MIPSKRARRSWRGKLALTVALVALGLVVGAGNGCDGGGEGDRCNPLLSHDECGKGLSCMQPTTCVESYCCPSPSTSSANPFCNGLACPPADASADAPDDVAVVDDAGAG